MNSFTIIHYNQSLQQLPVWISIPLEALQEFIINRYQKYMSRCILSTSICLFLLLSGGIGGEHWRIDKYHQSRKTYSPIVFYWFVISIKGGDLHDGKRKLAYILDGNRKECVFFGEFQKFFWQICNEYFEWWERISEIIPLRSTPPFRAFLIFSIYFT